VERGALESLRVAITGTNSRPFLLKGTDEWIGRALDEALPSAVGEPGAASGPALADHRDRRELPAPGCSGPRAAAGERTLGL